MSGWHTAKKKVYSRDENRCRLCKNGKPIVDLEVHHIVPYCECKSHEVDNLILLCSDCHAEVHRPIRLYMPNGATPRQIFYLRHEYSRYKQNVTKTTTREFMIYLLRKTKNTRSPICKDVRLHIKYIRAIMFIGYEVEIKLYFKGNGEVVMTYEVQRH